MRVVCLLSGEHPTLPAAELGCAVRVKATGPQVAVGECADPARLTRLALTHLVYDLIDSCGASDDAVDAMVRRAGLEPDGTFAFRVRKVAGALLATTAPALERRLGGMVRGRVSLAAPDVVYGLVCSADRCYLGRLVSEPNPGGFSDRPPSSRPFFHPGVMMPRLARALVNLSLVEPGEVLLDPFAGTGGTLIEATLVGARALGFDVDPVMLAGARLNLPGSRLVAANAARLPLRSGSVDAVVSDLPYGQSVRIRGESLGRLYDESLAEVARVLRPGRRAVIVTHRPIDGTAARHLAVVDRFEQRVHRSLTRRILVLER
ncbi:MAG: methyltransferase domain-containing protein [Methanospirillum sp.]|nr:methyltransferase domain-containing protein [Methanospirillum sp.]